MTVAPPWEYPCLEIGVLYNPHALIWPVFSSGIRHILRRNLRLLVHTLPLPGKVLGTSVQAGQDGDVRRIEGIMTKALKASLVSSVAVALIVLGGATARAEHIEGDPMAGHHQHLDLGIWVGAMSFDDVVDSDHGPVFGIRAGYDWDMHWGVEFVMGWQQSNLTSDATVNRDHSLLATSVTYNFRYDGDQVVVPYVGAGVGAWQEDTDNGAAQNEFLLHGIAGLRFRASKHISLMLDVREWYVPYYNPYKGKNVEANTESAQLHFAYRF